MAVFNEKNQTRGKRQIQEFSVGGGISQRKANHITTPVDLLYAKNCRFDKRIGGLTKRGGSDEEDLGMSVGQPQGTCQYDIADAGSTGLGGYQTTLFAGTALYKNGANYIPIANSAEFATGVSLTKQADMTMLGDSLFIACGVPGVWRGPGTEIDRVGIPAPTAAPTINSYSVGPITLTDGTMFMYTLYNDQTGLESDWSPLTDSTGSQTSVQINVTIPIPGGIGTNYNKARLYRTLDGGAFPYLVGTFTLGAVVAVTLTDAELLSRAPKLGDNGLPPDTSFICAKYGQCIFWVDAEDPFSVVFSKPFTGDNNEMQYYPRTNRLKTDDPVTAFYVASDKLLIFHPRSVSFLSGAAPEDFEYRPYLPGVGTLFGNSISSNGEELVLLAEEGFVTIDLRSGQKKNISKDVDLDLQPLLSGSYNTSFYASTCWNVAMRQFIFMVSAKSVAGAPWIDSVSGLDDIWQDSVSLVTQPWEDSLNPVTTDVTRVKIWGWSPEFSSNDASGWAEYSFPTIEDRNAAGSYPVYVFHPEGSVASADPQQPNTYVGYYNATLGEGFIRTIFRKDTNTDNGTTITAEWITGRIRPNGSTTQLLFQNLAFRNSYEDPTTDSLCTLKYLLDYDDAHIRNYSSSLISFTATTTDNKIFSSGLGAHIHLYGIDTSQSQDKLLMSNFMIHYRERFRRFGR